MQEDDGLAEAGPLQPCLLLIVEPRGHIPCGVCPEGEQPEERDGQPGHAQTLQARLEKALCIGKEIIEDEHLEEYEREPVSPLRVVLQEFDGLLP